MEQITKSVKDSDSLALKSSDLITTLQKSNASTEAPPWLPLLVQMAQDKRHDLAPGILRLWKVKLSGCTDREITQALELYSGEFFPSVDRVMQTIERRRERTNEEKGEAWGSEIQRNYSEIDKFKAAHGGKTPQQLWCEENQALIASLSDKLATSKTGRVE